MGWIAKTCRVYLSYGELDFRRALWVNGDALHLQRVFANLLMNSINHSPRRGKVEVVLEFYSGYQVVKILGGGQGITENRSPRGAVFGFRLPACPPQPSERTLR